MTATEGLTHYLEIVKEELDKSHPGIDLSRCEDFINAYYQGKEWTKESSWEMPGGVNTFLFPILKREGLTRKKILEIFRKTYSREDEWGAQ